MIRRLAIVTSITLALAATLVGCGKKGSGKAAPSASAAPTLAAPGTPVAITVTPKGFEPSHIVVAKGALTQLVFTRTTAETCATEVVIKLDAEHEIRKDLPMNQAVTIAATFPTSGELRFACGMDMVSGVITVQ